MCTDGRTDILKIIVTFRSFWNALKNYTNIYMMIVKNVQSLEMIPVKPAQISMDNSRNCTKVKE